MNVQDFEVFQILLKDVSGLSIDQGKMYLLQSRLRPLLVEHNLASISELARAVKTNPKSPLAWIVVEAMTTNETSFFRDVRPFDLFKDHIMPEIMKDGRKRKIRIWSAACSSGQEPYSLAMIIKEQKWIEQGWQFEIFATDISHDILKTAKDAVYSQFEVQRGLPIQMLVKYFTQHDGNKWHVNDDIKRMVNYKQFNLLHSMAGFGTFDIIFCRNVLIYFDPETKADVLQKMHALQKPEGFLLLGGAESVIGVTKVYKSVEGQRGLYAPVFQS